jgi:transposase, IS5 family
MAAIETYQARLGRTPHLMAADAGFYSAKNDAAAKAKGVKRVCIPSRSTKSPERKREQKKRWVGLGVIAFNLVNISRAMAQQPGP